MKHMIIMMGIQASGKTTFYHQNLESKYVHISLDELHTRNKEDLAIRNCIAAGQDYVIDNTNPTKKDREKYIRVARDNGYTITGYFFRSVVKECIARNEKREGKQRVPTTAIPCTSNKLEMPSKEEGFDELHYVYMSDDGFIVEEWK